MMPHWISLFLEALLYMSAGVTVFGLVLCACAVIGDWLRARGWDPIFNEDVREWEETLGRPLTQRERETLAEDYPR